MSLLAELVGESPGIVAVRAKLSQLLGRQDRGQRLPSVLLQGETGTGKGLLARLIHREGSRRRGPFVAVNCAAIPEPLFEAELFGFERGAFTDARQAKPGLFQTAHRGMLFLDEISLLPTALQPKLLKVIEERAVRRLGSTRSEPVDVWLVAASNEDLARAVTARGFRRDLYHRVAVVTLSLPPLRERSEDIPLLAEHFLARVCTDYGLAHRTLASDACAALLAYSWPGNVRELGNVLERAALLTDAPVITAANLELGSTAAAEQRATDPAATASPEALGFDDAVASVECRRLLDALRATNGNVARAASRLGISRNRLRYRIEKYGLRPRARSPRRSAGRHPPTPSPVPRATAPPLEATSPAPLRWEYRHVALLHVDLVFAPLADAPPDTSRALELLIEKVRTFGGRVQERGPRGIVAAFGLEPVEDAPNRAALAAMTIQKAAARERALDPANARVTLAVHVARLMVGQLGGHPRIHSDAPSDAATTLLRMLIARGEADTIVVSEAAVPFLERQFELVRGDQRAEDRAGAPYRLTRRERTGFGVGGRALSRFVGRDQELQNLEDRLAQVEQGHGQVVGMVGEPGVGKSRLVYEFTRSARLRSWRTLAGHAVSYGTTSPYLPIVDLLKHYWHLRDGEVPSRIRELVTEKVLILDRALEADVPALLSLLDAAIEDQPWQSLEPLQRRERTLDAIKRLLIRESHAQPLCLVFEDLHWIDTETQAALDRLIESLPTARILLLVTYRPEFEFRWGSKTYSTQLRLDSLDPERAEELLTTLVGAHADLSPLKRLLIERTEGNPFFLEESVRALVGSHALVGERGAYRPVKPVDAIHAPATVQAVLAARIDQLPADERALLQIASVIGKDVPFPLLRASAEMPEDKLRGSLEHLQAAEFLYERRLFPDLEYTFKHALTHEVAYESLLAERRRVLHAQIVEAIERLYAERLPEHVELLAHHCLNGEIWGKAALYLRQAGVTAAARSANHQAVAHLEKALAALEHLPEGRDRAEQAIDVRLALRPAFLALGEYGQMLAHLRDAEVLAQGIGDRRRLGWLLIYLASCLHWIGDQSAAINCDERVLAIAADLRDAALQAVCTSGLARCHYACGNYRRARSLFTEAIGQLRDDVSFERFGPAALPTVYSGSCLAWCLAQLGQFAEGAVHGDEALRIANMADQPFSLVIACLGVGSFHLLKGDLPNATHVLDRAVYLCRRWAIPSWLPTAASSLGYAHVLSGRVEHGTALLREGIDQAVLMKIGYEHVPSFAWLSEALLLDSQPDGAVSLAQRELERSLDRGYRGHEAYGLRALAEAAAHVDRDDIEPAEDYYHRAITLATELGMRPLVAHCHRGLGKLYRGQGKREHAQEHFTIAMTMYREMDMQFWLTRGNAELNASAS